MVETHMPPTVKCSALVLAFVSASACLLTFDSLKELPMPVSPSGVSWISAGHFRTCLSLDKL